MKRFLFLPFIIAVHTFASAQVVQWATEVISFSSELTPLQYSAQQALGKPNVLPAGGQNPNAWAPDKPNRNEFLKLGFAKPISIRQIAIAESHNPGSLYRILVYDEAGKEYEVYTFNPQAIPLQGRMLNVFMEKTPYNVAAVKLEFDGAAVPEYYGIDAVAISDTNYPVIAFIPTPELLATGLVIEPLDNMVNSTYSELNPLLSPDGKTLYFSRRNHPENIGGVADKEDIWYSELGEDGKWQLARNMGRPINNTYPNFINSITSDGTAAIMVLGNKYLDNEKMSAGVSISTYADGRWSDPKPITIANEYNLDEHANYYLSNDRKRLLASIKRRDSYGDRDLYVSFQQEDGNWTEPLNLGVNINTAATESAPFMVDDKTLYFSSNGFSGYGGADIYVTRRLDDTWTNWSDPENLGPEINSKVDDLFFNIPNFSEYAYYSRGESNNLDVYRVRLPIYRSPDIWVTVKGKLIDGVTGLPMGAKIVAEQLPQGKQITTVQTNAVTGEYEVKLKASELYSIRAEAEGHLSESMNVDLRQVATSKTIDHTDFTLEPLQVKRLEEDAIISLNTILFEFASDVLQSVSFPELDRMVSVLKERSSITVELAGHTCDIGNEQYNLTLSQRRAMAVKRYFVDKGVAKERIDVTFFGESKPVAPNTNEENRIKNRRVEFKIVKL
jgi:OmpA-OmpF porin, OOP family